MTTQEQPATDATSLRPFKIFWNEDGEYVSNLMYSDEQIEEINEMVFAVLRGLLDENRFQVCMVDAPDPANEDGNS